MSFFDNLFGAAAPAAMGYMFGGPVGAAVGGIGGLMQGRGRYADPAQAAMPYLNQIPAMAQQNLGPYVQRGNQGDANAANAYNRSYNEFANPGNVYPQEYNQMGLDPGAYMEAIMSKYEPSKGYQYKQNRMLQAMRNSAASGGFAGTELDREEQANAVKGMLGEDMQQFLSNILGIQQFGTGGRERGFERGILGRERALARMGEMGERQGAQGFQAASSLADILGGNLGQQAGAGYQGRVQGNEYREARQRNRNNFMGDLFGFGAGRRGYNGGMGGNAPLGNVFG